MLLTYLTAMRPEETHAWFLNRSKATRRFVTFGAVSFFAAFGIVTLQYVIWRAAGWGTANFLPAWSLVIIYGIAASVALPWIYYLIALTARFHGKIKWGAAAMMGAFVALIVAMAFAHSLPQLSTLVVSSPSEARLQIHRSRLSIGEPRYKRHCRNSIDFGPMYAFRGGWCGRYLGKGTTHTFQGHGNALAMRLHSIER